VAHHPHPGAGRHPARTGETDHATAKTTGSHAFLTALGDIIDGEFGGLVHDPQMTALYAAPRTARA
jgi:hypothetical protein